MKDRFLNVARTINVPKAVIPLFIVAAIFPFIDGNDYHLQVLTWAFIFIALSQGLNLLTGHAGIVDLGYIAFYAIGAYSYTIISQTTGLPFIAQVPILAIMAICVGMILGLPALRVRGDYLAVVTLGFGEIVRLIVVNWYSFTNGAQGLINVPQPWVFVTINTPVGYYLFALALLAIITWVCHRMVLSGIGWAWCALRTNEDLGMALGHNLVSLKLLAFCSGATIAMICGAFFASFQTFVSPESFILFESIMILSMVILGGGTGGNLMGVAIGAFTLSLMPELLRDFSEWRMPIYGIVMTVLVMRREKGILWYNWLKYTIPFHEILSDKRNKDRVLTDLGASRAHGLIGVEVTDVERSFGGVKALSGITYRFQPGKTYGIIGHNGAGKTTLVNVISNTLKTTGGSIKSFIHGSDGSIISDNSTQRGYDRFTSRTFQKVILVPDLDATQNVFLACFPSGLFNMLKELVLTLSPFGEKHRLMSFATRVDTALKDVSFPDDMREVSASQLPFGLKRKVELARALVVDAPVLLLDEPLSGLSIEEREELYNLLKKISKTGKKTIILVEHQIKYMQELCDHVFFMENGNIKVDNDGKRIEGDFNYVFSHPYVQSSYFGTEEAHEKKEIYIDVKKPVLRMTGLNVSYPNRGRVIYDADVDVPLNSIVLISGLNGSGKTTILKSIMGLGGTQVDSGRLEFNNDDICRYRPSLRAMKGIFYVPQENRIFPTLSVREHFFLGGSTSMDGQGVIHRVLNEWFPILREKWNVRAQDLSGGQQQMLALALSFTRMENMNLSEPCLIILDEPTTGLQPSLQQMTYKILRYYNENHNVGILLTEQRPEALNIVHKHYLLEAGHLSLA